MQPVYHSLLPSELDVLVERLRLAFELADAVLHDVADADDADAASPEVSSMTGRCRTRRSVIVPIS